MSWKDQIPEKKSEPQETDQFFSAEYMAKRIVALEENKFHNFYFVPKRERNNFLSETDCASVKFCNRGFVDMIQQKKECQELKQAFQAKGWEVSIDITDTMYVIIGVKWK